MDISKQIVAIFGGAVAGSELVHTFTAQGVCCVVFDQNILPHGKIEDGLPKWHFKQREKEELLINERMNHALVSYVPQCKLGRDISFEEVLKMNFSAVVLATGAWKDRSLPVTDIDEFVNKGLYYQNPFVYWYNHEHEPAFLNRPYDIVDDTAIVGGGLASLDVAKIIMMELVEAQMKERGISTNLFELNHGINKVLDKHRLTLQDLKIKGCTLYYRRRDIDMPLSHLPADTPEHIAKTQLIRQKILGNYLKKFLFRFQPCMVPVEKIVRDNKLAGLVFRKTEADEKKCIEIAGSEMEIFAPLVISSIGSLPEPIEGILSEGDTFKVTDNISSRLNGYTNVFVVGNAVTGKGNIHDSAHHAKEVGEWMWQNFLSESTAVSAETIVEIFLQVKKMQHAKNYFGAYAEWAKKHSPVRLEALPGNMLH